MFVQNHGDRRAKGAYQEDFGQENEVYGPVDDRVLKSWPKYTET